MYRLPRKRRILYSFIQRSLSSRSVSHMTSSRSCVTSPRTVMTSSKFVVTQHSGRCLHTSPAKLNIMERMAGVDKFKYDIIMPEDEHASKVNFSDVGGQYEAKVELTEIVDFLKDRKKYVELGARIPSGALLTGPPGNGKTLLARAIAGEACVPFINTAGPQFIEKIGGLGPKRVRELFEICKKLAPCILFIDEIDAFAKKRSGGGNSPQDMGGRGSEESNNTLNQLLVELDGINSRDEIFIIGATNRDDTLDNAVTRPGRLDRKVYIDNPTEIEREEVFRIHMKKLKLAKSITVTSTKVEKPVAAGAADTFNEGSYTARLAACTPGYSGAQVANICNEAAIQAARISDDEVTAASFELALERVSAGLERTNPTVSAEELKLSAYYMAGQGLLSFLLPSLTPVLKISIVSRVKNPVGFAQFAPRKELLSSKEHLLDLLCRGLAGKAAQKLFFNQITTQAEEDLKKISSVAYSMVADYGMGQSAPNMSFQEARSQSNRRINFWSNKLQAEIDQEVSQIVQEQYEKAYKTLEDNLELFRALAEELFVKRSLTEENVREIMQKYNNTLGP